MSGEFIGGTAEEGAIREYSAHLTTVHGRCSWCPKEICTNYEDELPLCPSCKWQKTTKILAKNRIGSQELLDLRPEDMKKLSESAASGINNTLNHAPSTQRSESEYAATLERSGCSSHHQVRNMQNSYLKPERNSGEMCLDSSTSHNGSVSHDGSTAREELDDSDRPEPFGSDETFTGSNPSIPPAEQSNLRLMAQQPDRFSDIPQSRAPDQSPVHRGPFLPPKRAHHQPPTTMDDRMDQKDMFSGPTYSSQRSAGWRAEQSDKYQPVSSAAPTRGDRLRSSQWPLSGGTVLASTDNAFSPQQPAADSDRFSQSMDAAMFRDKPTTKFSGFIERKILGPFWWKKRFYVLLSDGQFLGFDSSKQRSIHAKYASDAFDVHRAQPFLQKKKSDKGHFTVNGINIEGEEDTDKEFRTRTSKDAEDWCDAIVSVQNQLHIDAARLRYYRNMLSPRSPTDDSHI